MNEWITDMKDLAELVEKGQSPFHVAQFSKERLLDKGFQELNYAGKWKLEKGKGYVVMHHGSTLFGFRIGKNFIPGKPCRIAAAHTDFPCFRIKPNPEVIVQGYGQLNVEVYGGPILNTWMDRPLSVAGRVALKSGQPLRPEMKLFASGKPILTIPNLAIHMNRDVNKGVELNRQTDLLPIAGMLSGKEDDAKFFSKYLAGQLGVEPEDILDYELSVVSAEQPCLLGYEQELFSAPRLDNLTSVQALTCGICQDGNPETLAVIALFDHEEIGSKTKQGAGSYMFRDFLEKLLVSLGADFTQVKDSIYESMLLSVDVAHALHPNYAGKMDITNKPVLNAGVCLKEACSQSYATDSEAVGGIQQLCIEQEIPYQKFVNRSDMPGGGTLGSIASSILPLRTVDIGIPLLAMHSARECMGIRDQEALDKLLKSYLS